MKYILSVLIAGASSIALAQSNPVSSTTALAEETAALNAQAARDNAAAAAINAATAKVKAQTDALGLPKVEGKTTLNNNAGVLESWILSSYAVEASGEQIARKVATALATLPAASHAEVEAVGDDKDLLNVLAEGAESATSNGDNPTIVPPRRILLVSGDEALALDTAANVSGQIGLARRKLKVAANDLCRRRGGTPFIASATLLPLIGAAANLLKSDTEISGLDVTIPSRMLAAATGKHLRSAAWAVVLPSAAVATSQGSPTAKAWTGLLALRDASRGCLPSTPDDQLPDPMKPKVKALREAIAAADEMESKLLKADDKGNTPLGQAVRVDALMEGAHPYVLRVNVEKGGGSLLKRSNVWTALGASAVGITGGLISSYSLTDPYTGELIVSGNVACRTAMTSLRAVQTSKVKLPDSNSLCKTEF